MSARLKIVGYLAVRNDIGPMHWDRRQFAELPKHGLLWNAFPYGATLFKSRASAKRAIERTKKYEEQTKHPYRDNHRYWVVRVVEPEPLP